MQSFYFNLIVVTMDWWNDLWLNEGFASYIEYKGVDFCEKDWQMVGNTKTHPLYFLTLYIIVYSWTNF